METEDFVIFPTKSEEEFKTEFKPFEIPWSQMKSEEEMEYYDLPLLQENENKIKREVTCQSENTDGDFEFWHERRQDENLPSQAEPPQKREFPKQVNPNARQFNCSFCDYKSNNRANFKRHVYTHTGEKPLQCDLCNYRCIQSVTLKRHKYTHTGERPSKCKLCDYKGSHSSDLKNHMFTHTGEKPHKCPVCDFRCRQVGGLRQHMLTHAEKKPFRCTTCPFSCTTSSTLKVHLRTHTGEKPYKCDTCDYSSSRAGQLKLHKLTHSNNKTLKCGLCEYTCTQTRYLKSHMSHTMHATKQPYKCCVCEYSSAYSASFKNHMFKHSDEEMYQCQDCDYRCESVESFMQHIEDTHSNFFKCYWALSKNQRFPLDKDGPQRPDVGCTVIKEEPTVSTFDDVSCRKQKARKTIKREKTMKEKSRWILPAKSLRRSLRVENIKSELEETKAAGKRAIEEEVEEAIRVIVPAFKCRICKDGVQMNVIDFKAHYQTLHKGIQLPRTAKYLHIYTCDVCSKIFKCWKNFENHMETHNNLYDCEWCGVNYKKVLDYILHMRSHCLEGLFKCIHCDYVTSSVNEISVHVNMKHEIINRKYICEICDKGFSMFTWFKEHGNFHTGEKPFKCELCDKSFMYTRHLTAHKLCIHKQSVPRVLYGYECVICKKKYQHRNSLKLHMNIHTGQVVICDVCGRQLSSMEKLKFHMRVHTGYKPFKCSYCEKAFTKKPILVEHERIHTGTKPYICGHCKRPFSQRSSLVIHIRGHTGERPFACHICGKAFVARAMLNLHFKTCKGVY